MADDYGWSNDDQHDLIDVFEAVGREAAQSGEMCRETEWVTCTRAAGHAGRHIALGTERPVGAWPGSGRPTLNDMAEVSR